MKILVLGSGGREHALSWKISQSSHCDKVYVCPGNGGIFERGFSKLPLSLLTPESLLQAIQDEGIDLVVIGPEAFLHQGYGDFLRSKNVLVVGPGKRGAELETSKIFAKDFMNRAGIPTAPSTVLQSEKDWSAPKKWPVVLKFDGLAAGKGVVIAQNESEARDFFDRAWNQKEFGGTGRILVEEFIPGKEVSLMGLCDGAHFLPFTTATDYKRIFDGNRGPNTGGMGAISPSPYFSKTLEQKIEAKIIQPCLRQLQKDGIEYRGTLYIGLMIDEHNEPFVLEFNARFGDPETQAIMLRLKSDFVEALLRTAKGQLGESAPLEFIDEKSLYVVGAAEGYPEKVKTGDTLPSTGKDSKNTTFFFAGLSEKNGSLVTSGGRVLGVGVTGPTFADCRKVAYEAMKQVEFRGIQYRHDIGE